MKKLEPVKPGEMLMEEFIIPLGLNRSRLADELSVPRNRIAQIVKGTREITADTALRLSRYFGTTPEFWMNAQAHYNLELARDSVGETIKKTVKKRGLPVEAKATKTPVAQPVS